MNPLDGVDARQTSAVMDRETCCQSRANALDSAASLGMRPEASADGEPLTASLRPARRRDRSLSPIENRPRETVSVPADQRPENVDGRTREGTAWDMTDKDASGWDDEYQDGRSSPFSKRNQKNASAWEGLYSASLWLENSNYNHSSARRFDLQRRAVTDSYISENNAHDLAHLIAVQLLSACFTLPLDYMPARKPAENNALNTFGSGDIPDSRLISSLRMNTEVRYSSPFRYQARSGSPASLWRGGYDGPNLSASPEPPSSQGSPGIRKTPRRKKIHRIFHASANSVDEYFTASSSNRGGDLEAHKFKSARRHRAGSHRGSLVARRRRSSLQPVILSEPHPVYIQPVKELAVRRWQTFRRRFGNSLSQGHPDPRSTAADFMVSNHSSNSTPSCSPGGSTISSEAKDRRRLARERGDIHSSVESSPRYNSPISAGSSGAASPAYSDLRNIAPAPQNSPDGLEAEASTNTSRAKKAHTDFPNRISLSTPNPQFNSGAPNPPSPVTVPTNSTESNAMVSTNTRKSKASTTSRARGHRRQRKSLLSEVCTPDSLDDERNALSAAGSTLASPQAEPGCKTTHGPALPITGDGPLEPHVTCPASPASPDVEMPEIARPPMVRVSTSGTQIITPSKDGLEIDGIPVGPSSAVWGEERRWGKKPEKSFL